MIDVSNAKEAMFAIHMHTDMDTAVIPREFALDLLVALAGNSFQTCTCRSTFTIEKPEVMVTSIYV